MDLAARNVGHLRVEQRSQSAQDAALRLPAQSQQNEVVARKNRVDDLRHHGIVIADDARENRPTFAQPGHQVIPQLVFHMPGTQTRFREGTMAQLAKGLRNTHDRKLHEGQRL